MAFGAQTGSGLTVSKVSKNLARALRLWASPARLRCVLMALPILQ
jgi:hypothetical protein